MKDTFYAVQMMIDGFGHDTTTMICYRTKEECEKWIEKNAARFSKNLHYSPSFEVVKQVFGTEFEEVWG